MAELPLQLVIKRIFSKKRGKFHTFREFRKHLKTSSNYLQIKSAVYTAGLDREFYDGAEPRYFIEQIDTLMDSGEILKKGDAVYVSHIVWNDKDIVIKRYDHKGFIHSLRHTIKKTRARKGWWYAHVLGTLNIATPRALAFVEQRKGLLIWQSYLVTEYVEGEKLWHFLQDDDVTEQEKLNEVHRVVGLLDELWAHRITHGDLKHVNVLVTENGPVLIDLDGMIVHRWELIYRNKRAKDMERFLRKTNLPPAIDSYCQLLISGRKESFRNVPEGFEKNQMDSWVIIIDRNFPKHLIRNFVAAKDSLIEGQIRFIRVPSSDYTRVFKCSIFLNGIACPLYLKKYLYRSALDFIKHLFRPSRAKRAFNATLMLLKNGFNVPAVKGLFEQRLGLFCANNLLLTEEVKNSKSMEQLLDDICQNSGSDALICKRTLIEAFGGIIGRMHSKGIFHGDLRLGNVLVVKEQQEWRFFFIDNERTRKYRHLPDRLRLKNLVQINMFRSGITNTDRLRFFKAYVKDNPIVANNWKDWLTRIFSKTELRIHNKHSVYSTR